MMVIAFGAVLAIYYAQGGLRFTDNGLSPQTGLLVINSLPTGAEVLINNRLVTATDDTLYLDPDTYMVEIKKDGYNPWRKTLQVETGLVTQTNTRLFPIAPSLTNLTFMGAGNITPSPDGQKLLYYTDQATIPRRNGLYVLEMVGGTFALQRGPRQISEDSGLIDLTTAQFIWSPDSAEVMILDENREVLIDVGRRSNLDELPDISFQRRQILSDWEQEIYLQEQQALAQFPDEVAVIATQSAKNVYWSPDKKLLLYTATEAVNLPEGLVPPLPATSTQPEERSLNPGSIYVYDREEDKNFKVGEEEIITSDNGEPSELTKPEKWLIAARLAERNKLAEKEELEEREAIMANEEVIAGEEVEDDPLGLVETTAEDSDLDRPQTFDSLQNADLGQTALNFQTYYSALYTNTFQWFPDSRHLLYVRDDKVYVVGYDNTNPTVLYAGPFAESFLYPWPDSSRVLILTTFSPDSPANLYAVELK